MNQDEIRMHLAAGRYYGKVATCGPDEKPKVKFTDEESASKALVAFKNPRHPLEVYPCYWCDNWHLGREMDAMERKVFSGDSGRKLLEMEEFSIGDGITLRVHNRKVCAGEYCSIHNPSVHHMNTWPLNWRDDRRIMERICSHGVGHPDPDDAYYRRHRDDGDEYDNGSHGCDGCCAFNKTEWLVRNYGTQGRP